METKWGIQGRWLAWAWATALGRPRLGRPPLPTRAPPPGERGMFGLVEPRRPTRKESASRFGMIPGFVDAQPDVDDLLTDPQWPGDVPVTEAGEPFNDSSSEAKDDIAAPCARMWRGARPDLSGDCKMTPPTLDEIAVSGYRCFDRWGEQPLRPLTLLYGRNNAGKSTLLRLASIIARSVGLDANSPFDLSGPEGRGASFLDALWAGANSRQMRVRLRWSDGSSDEFVLRFEDEAGEIYVQELRTQTDGEPTFEAKSKGYPDLGQYNVTDQEEPATITFTGLVPEADSHPALLPLAERLRSLRRSTTWLQSLRAGRQIVFAAPRGMKRGLGPEGKEAWDLVVHDDDLRMEANRFFSSVESGRSLRVDPKGDETYKLLLGRSSSAGRNVSIQETGEGMSQVLPVLVGAALANRKGSGAILAVEEPESHLHEDARRALAEHLCLIAAGDSPPALVLETHSRTFLLGIQLAIAERRIDPDRVAVVWVQQSASGEAEATMVELDHRGRPTTSALDGVLAEDRRLARRLAELQIED